MTNLEILTGLESGYFYVIPGKNRVGLARRKGLVFAKLINEYLISNKSPNWLNRTLCKPDFENRLLHKLHIKYEKCVLTIRPSNELALLSFHNFGILQQVITFAQRGKLKNAYLLRVSFGSLL